MGKQRREEILRRVQRERYVSVSELASTYAVDASTIRRDLDKMAALGMIARSHGGAMLPAEPAETPYDLKIEQNVAEKRTIARTIAQMVPHGSSLLMDSGSTTLEVARALRHHREMTVITNDLRVAAEIANQGDVHLIVLGGEVLPTVYTLMSERAVDMIGEFHVDYAIMGTDAIDPRGLMNTNSNEVSMKRAMMAAAQHVIVVADSSKFDRAALVRVADLDQVDLIVTDDGLAEEAVAHYPVRVERVPVEPNILPPPPERLPASPRTSMEPAVVPEGVRVPPDQSRPS